MRFRSAIALVAAALVIGGCGSDDEDQPGGESESSTTTSQATTTESTTSTTEPTSTVETTTTTEATTTSTEDTTGLPKQRCRGAESPPNIVDVISYGADCGAVEAAMAELQSVAREFRIGDFECARVSGVALSGVWECRGEASYFTFVFGD